MDGSAKVGDKLVVLDTGTAQHTHSEVPKRSTSGTSVWGNSDEQAASSSFWPDTQRRHTSQEGVAFRPSEVHRLKTTFASEAPADPCHSELDDLDDKIAATFAAFRAAPRDSVERTELSNQLDALKAAKEALQDELDDVANWSQ